jgi:hypothetical protein
LRREGVAILVATRPGGVFDADRNGLPRVRVGGLDAGAARALLEAAHGALPARVADAISAGTEGNPLALLEVPRLLSEAQLAGRQPLDAPLPVGPALERALLSRLSGVSEAVRQGLLVAAASGGERVQPVVDALGCLGLRADVLAIAEEAGVVRISGERFEFRHPLLRSAVYHDARAAARRTAHATLAHVTLGEARAWHLAQATVGEDEAVAAVSMAARSNRFRATARLAASDGNGHDPTNPRLL